MKAIALNGSPRKNGNTAALLRKALQGAETAGAETELVHIYDLNYKGCISCFACKRIGGSSYGRCAVQDDLTPIIDRATEADILLFGSPIYFGDVTGELRSLIERMFYGRFSYETEKPSLWPRKTLGAFLYTMNLPSDDPYRDLLKHSLEDTAAKVLGPVVSMSAVDTCQFDDYSKYYAPKFDAEHKQRRREEVFPRDGQRAYELGRLLAEQARQNN